MERRSYANQYSDFLRRFLVHRGEENSRVSWSAWHRWNRLFAAFGSCHHLCIMLVQGEETPASRLGFNDVLKQHADGYSCSSLCSNKHGVAKISAVIFPYPKRWQTESLASAPVAGLWLHHVGCTTASGSKQSWSEYCVSAMYSVEGSQPALQPRRIHRALSSMVLAEAEASNELSRKRHTAARGPPWY